MQIGKRIYYDNITGEVLVVISERSGSVVATIVEDDITNYTELTERNRHTFDYVELSYGQYNQDFMECNGYRVNPITKEIEFSYPDPSEETIQEPIYQTPLSEELNELKTRAQDIELALADIVLGGM